MLKRDLYRRILTVVLIIVGLVCVRLLWIEPIRIHNNNMAEALTKKENVLAIKNRKLTNLDLVAYKHDDKKYVGRVIGIPGQKVVMFDDVLYINDKIIKETYIKKNQQTFLSKYPDEEYSSDFTVGTIMGNNDQKVPSNQYLILNDNRQVKEDSRKFGLIPKDEIIGVVNFKYLPLKDFGFVQNDEAKIENGFVASDEK